MVWRVAAAVLAGLACAAVAGAQEWGAAPPLRVARAALTLVAHEDAIFAVGGTTPDGATVDVDRFDGRTWSRETTLPGGGLNAAAAALVGDRLYVLGGFVAATNRPSDRVHVYDLGSREWSEAAPLPSPRGGFRAIVIDGRIHVVGGGNDRTTLADHDVYDPATNTWSSRAPLPSSRGNPALAVLDGRLYAIGGGSGGRDFGETAIYDFAADAWSAGPPVTPRVAAAAVMYDGAILLLGGERQERREVLATAERLGSGADAWAALPPMPTARSYTSAVVWRDAVWVGGGATQALQPHTAAGTTAFERFAR